MPAHLLSIPSPSGEEGVDTETTQFSASSPSTPQRPPKEKEREADYGERETARGDAGRMQQRWLRARCRERLRGKELLWSESNGPQGRGI